MDPLFLKWMAEVFKLSATNLEALEKFMGQGRPAGPFPDWSGKTLPGMPPLPFPPEKMEELYREWLSLFGAVPQKDYQELEKKALALEEKCREMTRAMQTLAAGMAELKDAPEMLKPWFDLAEKTARANLEWFAKLQKSMEGERAKNTDKGEN